MNRLFGLCFTSYGSKVGARHKRRVSEIHAVKTFCFVFLFLFFLLFFKFSKLNSSSRFIVGNSKERKFKRR